MFGHPVELNFDKNEYKKKSWIGGLFSILIIVYMVIFVITNIQKLQDNSSSDIKIINGSLDLVSTGSVNLKSLDFLMFYSVRKNSEKKRLKQEDLRRFLNISFSQVEEDWN